MCESSASVWSGQICRKPILYTNLYFVFPLPTKILICWRIFVPLRDSSFHVSRMWNSWHIQTLRKKKKNKKKENRLESHLEAHVDVTVLEGGGDVRWRKQGMSLLVVLLTQLLLFICTPEWTHNRLPALFPSVAHFKNPPPLWVWNGFFPDRRRNFLLFPPPFAAAACQSESALSFVFLTRLINIKPNRKNTPTRTHIYFYMYVFTLKRMSSVKGFVFSWPLKHASFLNLSIRDKAAPDQLSGLWKHKAWGAPSAQRNNRLMWALLLET